MMNRPEKIALTAFLFWIGAGLVFTVVPLTPSQMESWPTWGLGRFVGFCLREGDPILILLAFANTHLLAARAWGARAARRWALVIIVLSAVIETLGTLTGFPFGAYTYTDQFGPLLGVVPLTIPLAWQIILTNAHLLTRALLPGQNRFMRLTFSALLCTFYDFILEPFATQVKHYWIWEEGKIPVQNYLAWFLLSAGLIGFFAPRQIAYAPRAWLRPALILGGTLLIFLAGRLVHRV